VQSFGYKARSSISAADDRSAFWVSIGLGLGCVENVAALDCVVGYLPHADSSRAGSEKSVVDAHPASAEAVPPQQEGRRDYGSGRGARREDASNSGRVKPGRRRSC